MSGPLDGKVAIVTGASRGIGRAVALKLGTLKAAVIVNFVHDATAAAETVDRLEKAGGRAIAIQADMRRIGEIEALFDRTIARLGSVDILVNNAGVRLFKPIEAITEAEFDHIFDTNVKGVFFACQMAAKRMADGGRIINISSSVTRVLLPNYGAYAATKGAVDQITRVMAKELGPRSITVNAVSPGPTDTELFRKGKTLEQIDGFARDTALGRIGTPDDIADAVALLAGPDAGWISGQNIYANGGFVA
jgi:3-oxoacyl-[acyl-carrier protein] reductase